MDSTNKEQWIKSNKKKLNILREMFFSEKAYIDDLKLWHIDFKKEILNMKCIPTKKKYFITETIFANINEIYNGHIKFYNEMKKINYKALKQHYNSIQKKIDQSLRFSDDFILPMDGLIDISKVEYATLYIKYFPTVSSNYINYMKQLPNSLYEFEKLKNENKKFTTNINQWLKKHHVENLGINHFFFRPSTKAARYPLLNKRLRENEPNPEFLKLYYELNQNTIKAIKMMDQVYNENQKYHKLFNMSKQIQYHTPAKNIYYLGLFHKHCQLIQENKLIIKMSVLHPASYKYIFLINNMLLISQVRENQFKPIVLDDYPLFLSKYMITTQPLPFFDKADNLNMYYPIYLIQEATLDIKGIYFEDKYSMNAFYDQIKTIIKKSIPRGQNKKFHLDIRTDLSVIAANATIIYSHEINLTKNENNSISDLTFNASKDESIDDISSIKTTNIVWNSLSKLEAKYTGSKTTNFKNIYEDENINPKKSIIQKIFDITGDHDVISQEESTTEPSSNNAQGWCISFDQQMFIIDIQFIIETYSDIPFMLIVTPEGIFKIINNIKTRVSECVPSKLKYIPKYQLLVYQVKNKLYITQFHASTTSFDPQEIPFDIIDFFINLNSKKEHYITLVTKGDYGFSNINLLNVFKETKYIRIMFYRKLCVAGTVYSVDLINDRLVIATNTFEIVDIKTLKTQNLLEQFDPYTSAFISQIQYISARKIFKINSTTYLLCFNGIGFYCDENGKYKYSGIYFVWEDVAKDFKIYKNHLYVLSLSYISIFDLETGKLIFCQIIKDGKFVYEHNGVSIFSKHGIFRIKSGEAYNIDTMEKNNYGFNMDITKEMNRFNLKQKSSIPPIPSKYQIYSHKPSSKIVSDNLIATHMNIRTKKVHIKTDHNDEHHNICKSTHVNLGMLHTEQPHILSVHCATGRDVFQKKNRQIYTIENNSTGTINDIICEYEEKYKNYKLMTLKLV